MSAPPTIPGDAHKQPATQLGSPTRSVSYPVAWPTTGVSVRSGGRPQVHDKPPTELLEMLAREPVRAVMFEMNPSMTRSRLILFLWNMKWVSVSANGSHVDIAEFDINDAAMVHALSEDGHVLSSRAQRDRDDERSQELCVLFHKLWSKSNGRGYVKKEWMRLAELLGERGIEL